MEGARLLFDFSGVVDVRDVIVVEVKFDQDPEQLPKIDVQLGGPDGVSEQ